MTRSIPSHDSDTLERFVAAQAGTFEIALSELRQGRKRNHWMWFIFPQLLGLGRSQMSQHYGIADLDEARRYLSHPVLKPRLVKCFEATLAHDDASAEAIFGPVDASKLRSSATLFAMIEDAPDVFDRVLATFFDARPCRFTSDRLG